MNNKLIVFLILFINFSCYKQVETIYKTHATIYLVNETSETIKSDDTLGYTIQPGKTIIHTESNELDGDRPSINNFFLSFQYNNNKFIYGEQESKCETRIYNIYSYENRKELMQDGDIQVFEFTFRFTEKKKDEAEICN